MFSLRRRTLAKACVALSAAALTFTLAPEARADSYRNLAEGLATIFFTGTSILVTGTVFTIHDAAIVSPGEPPALGWSIAESALMTPSALLLNGLLVRAHLDGIDSNLVTAVFLVPAAWTGAMSAHGIWSLAAPSTDRGTVYGVSWALGANLAFTTGAVSALLHENRTPPMAFGIVEMLGTTPTILVGAAQLLDPAGRDRGAWTALTAWSGALFVHGGITLATAIVRAREDDKDAPTMDAEKSRGGFAPRWHFAPTLVSDGVLRAPGIGVSGVF
ncbi:hypothetical protein [Polyangium sorediatum]|uniref:Uncharacterized protein n=1 Tax=Polyangium sorediatum TaxID=889274 RepID=A0ABT6P1I6_9BACT|nr:hypothetical protein [Polyangium sorediatum]MDI1434466.1 hypothetical protein [Polyangium sorediatum]